MSKPVFQDFLSTSGRRDRSSYVLASLVHLAIGAVGLAVAAVAAFSLAGLLPRPAGQVSHEALALALLSFSALGFLQGIVLFFVHLPVAIQRCHDIGWGGWSVPAGSSSAARRSSCSSPSCPATKA
ncbi:DUF805 domain-containing protein [Cereibacter sphaeroides]|uniref:DUF805 domain-containing protein n=1 Tax=Cereibacter sphaeroides TaxID=1063 RepID=UPI001F3CB2E8|nr:DUF805 domain-containing protein [Cereibacter sphaeroides]MCE6958759.1 DUF805 domain-containing protein [Cereibacter sphaeroides]MCE6973367.1 DUF805 domain-containing protein [Cereibacter sphaeroides]